MPGYKLFAVLVVQDNFWPAFILRQVSPLRLIVARAARLDPSTDSAHAIIFLQSLVAGNHVHREDLGSLEEELQIQLLGR